MKIPAEQLQRAQIRPQEGERLLQPGAGAAQQQGGDTHPRPSSRWCWSSPTGLDARRDRRPPAGGTVVLNLEQTNKDIARRLLDFLSGITCNEGKIKKVALSTYIITPYNVDILGDLIDELENNRALFLNGPLGGPSPRKTREAIREMGYWNYSWASGSLPSTPLPRLRSEVTTWPWWTSSWTCSPRTIPRSIRKTPCSRAR